MRGITFVLITSLSFCSASYSQTTPTNSQTTPTNSQTTPTKNSGSKNSSSNSTNPTQNTGNAGDTNNGGSTTTGTCVSNTEPPGSTRNLYCSMVGGFEQVDLSSLPSQTEPFLRFYIQSGQHAAFTGLLWSSIRLLGSPNQTDTNGIFSVFTDPTGQITAEKLSSVGAAVDFLVGAGYRFYSNQGKGPNSVDLILGFGATTPLQSNKVTQAFTAPAFGTAECNILYAKLGPTLSSPVYNVQKSTTGIATGSTTACLINANAPTTTTGTTTFAPINTIAFSNVDRTSFFLKDLAGVRFNHTAYSDTKNKECSTSPCYLGTLDFSFGNDSAITGGVLRGNRWVFKTDGVYPIIVQKLTTLYLFGSFSIRLARNSTDNTPLILQPATLTTVTGTGSNAVPNVNTVVLPLRQPDRDFYRIGVGIDVLSFFKSKKQTGNGGAPEPTPAPSNPPQPNPATNPTPAPGSNQPPSA
jgi:hypothetical protein